MQSQGSHPHPIIFIQLLQIRLRSGTLFQVEGTMHLGDRHYLLPFVKRQASGLGLDISNPQLQVSLPSHPLSQFILKGGDMPQ